MSGEGQIKSHAERFVYYGGQTADWIDGPPNCAVRVMFVSAVAVHHMSAAAEPHLPFLPFLKAILRQPSFRIEDTTCRYTP